MTAESRDVAARLVNEARRRAQPAMREEIDWDRRPGRSQTESPDRLQGTRARPADVLADAVRDGAISLEEARLVLSTRRTIRELGTKLGVSVVAPEQRRHRARRRLLEWVRSTPSSHRG